VVRADELAEIPLFASLSEASREKLAPWFEATTAGEGVRLTGEGAAGYSFFILAEGGAVVTSDGATLANLGPGDFFGEVAILGDGRRTQRSRRPHRPTSSSCSAASFEGSSKRTRTSLTGSRKRCGSASRSELSADASPVARGRPPHAVRHGPAWTRTSLQIGLLLASLGAPVGARHAHPRSNLTHLAALSRLISGSAQHDPRMPRSA
jgi:hypothetical protein